MKKIKIIAVIGPSCSGKTTFVENVNKGFMSGYYVVKASTTRPRRWSGEREYYFLTDYDFNKIEENEWLTKSTYNNWFYGHKVSDFLLTQVNIGVFNLQQLKQLQESKEVDLFVIYLNTNKKIRLERALARTPNQVDEVVRRYLADEEEYANLNIECPHVVWPGEQSDALVHILLNLGQYELKGLPSLFNIM